MRAERMNEGVHVQEAPVCFLCGAEGAPLYRGLRDRLFGAPGAWHVRRCPHPECGLLWLDPMPSAQDISKVYPDYYTHRDDKPSIRDTWARRAYGAVKEGYLAARYGYFLESTPFWKRLVGILMYLDPARRAYLDFNVMYLRAQPQGQLLDVGCGNGDLMNMMRRLRWAVAGVEIDPVAVSRAQSNGLEVHLGDLESARYPDNHFDAVTMRHVIEHVHDPLRILKECHRILKPGGHVVIVTPNAKSWGHKLFQEAWVHLDPPRHLRVFAPGSLGRLVERAGFWNIRVATTLREADGVFLMSRSIQRSGKYLWGGAQPRAVRLWARAMQLAEWAVLKVNPDAGEEIALVARK